MNVIVCLDDRNGMMFHQRRLSKDRAVIKDILDISKDSILYMNEYSYKMFEESKSAHVLVRSDFLSLTAEGQYCLVEDCQIHNFSDKIEKLIIYKWNRTYPADLYFDYSFEQSLHLVDTTDLQGFSHKQVTREIYSN